MGGEVVSRHTTMGDEEELDGIWSTHRPQTAERLDALRAVARAAADGPLPPELRARGIAEAHVLAGAASIFGFHEATPLAREVERLLQEATEGDGADAGRLTAVVERLAALIDRERPERGS